MAARFACRQKNRVWTEAEAAAAAKKGSQSGEAVASASSPERKAKQLTHPSLAREKSAICVVWRCIYMIYFHPETCCCFFV
jgi:hypothetical protein